MTALTLKSFAGMVPRISRQKLPPEGAELAENCDLLSGDLRATRQAKRAVQITTPDPAAIAFRIPALLRGDIVDPPPCGCPDEDDLWIGFAEEFSHFVKGPLINDAYDRWYFTEEGQRPKYNTMSRMISGSAAYILGVPAPDTIPSVTPSGGTVALNETRCYVYTYLTTYGEESAPSEPTCAEGAADGTWTIGNLDTSVAEPWGTSGAPVTKKRIYRTITGRTGASFFFVDEVTLATTSYADTIPTDEVALNIQLESASWGTPPDNLVGIIRHPNGFMIGFEEDGDLRFSVPYRPHAWPASYALTTEGRIQAVSIFGQTIAVLTNAHPYAAVGTRPNVMTLVKSSTVAPCINRLSAVAFESGVIYASPDGLVMMSPSGVNIISEAYVSRSEWRTRYDPAEMRATKASYGYYAISKGGNIGFLMTPNEPRSAFTEVAKADQTKYTCLHTDLYSGKPYTLVDNFVWWLDCAVTLPDVYTWRSSEFVTAKPVNFGVYHIDFDELIRFPEQDPDDSVTDQYNTYLAWNTERIQTPLAPINFGAINACKQVTMTPPNDELPQNRQPLGGSPLYTLSYLAAAYVTFRLIGDRSVQYEKKLTRPGTYRLPAGYMSDLWQVEFRGTADLYHFKMAETGKELASV